MIQFIDLCFIFEDKEPSNIKIPRDLFVVDPIARPDLNQAFINNELDKLSKLHGWELLFHIPPLLIALFLGKAISDSLPPLARPLEGKDKKKYLCVHYGMSLRNAPENLWADLNSVIAEVFRNTGVYWFYDGSCPDNSYVEEFHKEILRLMGPGGNTTVIPLVMNMAQGENHADEYFWFKRQYHLNNPDGIQIDEPKMYQLFDRDDLILYKNNPKLRMNPGEIAQNMVNAMKTQRH